jgi:hypothetical protein
MTWDREIADAMAANEHATVPGLRPADHGMVDDLGQDPNLSPTPESIEQGSEPADALPRTEWDQEPELEL